MNHLHWIDWLVKNFGAEVKLIHMSLEVRSSWNQNRRLEWKMTKTEKRRQQMSMINKIADNWASIKRILSREKREEEVGFDSIKGNPIKLHHLLFLLFLPFLLFFHLLLLIFLFPMTSNEPDVSPSCVPFLSLPLLSYLMPSYLMVERKTNKTKLWPILKSHEKSNTIYLYSNILPRRMVSFTRLNFINSTF